MSKGFNYYKADTDRFQDIKIKRLKKQFGPEGYCVYQYALNEIYRVDGCFLQWTADHVFDCAEYWGITEDRVNEIIKYCTGCDCLIVLPLKAVFLLLEAFKVVILICVELARKRLIYRLKSCL